MKSTDSDPAPYLFKEKYTKALDYESNLSIQMSRIATFRSTQEYRKYFSSVDTLVFMLPSEMRSKALEYKKEYNVSMDVSNMGVERYDNYWMYINGLLEEANLIYRTVYTKTYE